MAVRVVSRFYLTFPDAVQAVADLTVSGVREADISLIESEDDARLPPEVSADSAQSPAASGATLGGGIGGGLGVLIGVGAIDFPVLEPIASLGWLLPTIIGTVIGAAIGAALGIVTRFGIVNRQAHSFASGLQRGEHLVMVRVDETAVAKTEAILANTHRQAAVEAPLPPHAVLTLDQTRDRTRQAEERIQYTSK